MFVNHLIVGSSNVAKSSDFYCQFLDFAKTNDDPGSKDGQVLATDRLDLLVLSFPQERLPNPAHFALEVKDIDRFNALLSKAHSMDLHPRQDPSRNAKPGFAEFERGDALYRHFYIYDPSEVNLEIMVRIPKKI